jgi:hypothetical protein
MAHTSPGMSKAIYNVYAPQMARDYAYAMCGGLNKDFDQEKWQRLYDGFLERVNTPEKLMDIAAVMHPAEGDD